jgi:hypothetical protein
MHKVDHSIGVLSEKRRMAQTAASPASCSTGLHSPARRADPSNGLGCFLEVTLESTNEGNDIVYGSFALIHRKVR